MKNFYLFARCTLLSLFSLTFFLPALAQEIPMPNSCFESNANDWTLIGGGAKTALINGKSNCSPSDERFLKWTTTSGASIRNANLPYNGPGTYTVGAYVKVPTANLGNQFEFRLIVLDNGSSVQVRNTAPITPKNYWGNSNSGYFSQEIDLTHACSGSCTVHFQLRALDDGIFHVDSTSLRTNLSVVPGPFAPQGCRSCDEIRLTLCQHDQAPDLRAYVKENTNYDPANYLEWYADNAGNPGAVLSSVPTVDSSQKGSSFYWVAQKSGPFAGPAILIRVRVKKLFVPEFSLPSVECAGGQLDLAAWVSDPAKKATAYTFYNSNPSNGSATPLGTVSATKGVVDAWQYMIVNVNNGNNRYWVQSTVPNGCGGIAESILTAPVKARLDYIPNVSVNSGESVNLSFSGLNATHFVWLDHSSFNNPNIGIVGAAGIGNLRFTAYNPGSSPLTAVIRVIAYNGNCAGRYRDVNITVNPGPVSRRAASMLALEGSFTGAQEVELKWDFSYEFETLRFDIEKQDSEGNFRTIAAVSWNGQTTYQFRDKEAVSASQIYRIKVLLADGRSIWSNEIRLNKQTLQVSPFSVYPNPASDLLYIRANLSEPVAGSWKMLDVTGKILLEGSLAQENEISISSLASGIYSLIITTAHSQTFTHRILKK